jgi:hypothetical protein
VIQAVEEFLSVRQPAVLVIASKQEQLGRIYETYLRREAVTIEGFGYRLAGTERIEPFAGSGRRTRAGSTGRALGLQINDLAGI